MIAALGGARQKMTKYKLRILYKSGNSQEIECTDFTIKGPSNAREITWENAEPRPLLLGVDDVEAVYQL
jgi:hypothetical protein